MLYENTNTMPKHADGTVLHLGVRVGQVSNRIVSVGSLDRARLLASMLDSPPKLYESARGFAIFTGTMHDVAISVIATGMGAPNMDFVVRETRAIVDGPIAIIRFGTCGGLQADVAPGSVIVSGKGSVAITRDPDAFLVDAAAVADCTEKRTNDDRNNASCYRVSRVVAASASLSTSLFETMAARVDAFQIAAAAATSDVLLTHTLGVYDGLNATACSFYSSQGRVDGAFDDRNEHVIEHVLAQHPALHSLEMETFHLLDLAQRSRGSIEATAAALVVANRLTAEVVDARVLRAAEAFYGRAVLECLARHSLQRM